MGWIKRSLILSLIIIFFLVYNKDHYKNIGGSGAPHMLALLKWKLTREKPQWPELPKIKPDMPPPNIPKYLDSDDIMVTAINHSSFLIQTGDENILTDPIWSDYAGPFGKFGVKRSIYPGVDMDDLPRIDFILISHNHYDHLDVSSIEALVERFNPILIMGLGVSKNINYCQIRKGNCYELNWWEKVQVYGSKNTFTFVPANHWSSRYSFDKDTSLWGGFVINNGNDNIYFAGDTGISDDQIFKQIKEEFGNIKLSFLPIGSYKPEWFFYPMHTSPFEAMKILKLLESEYAIPMHYDVFQLSDEKYEDPLSDLAKAMENEQVPAGQVIIMKPGDSVKVPD
ncbi:MAG: MBL fold metallo-hydrolase [Pseudomonadota bacterium]